MGLGPRLRRARHQDPELGWSEQGLTALLRCCPGSGPPPSPLLSMLRAFSLLQHGSSAKAGPAPSTLPAPYTPRGRAGHPAKVRTQGPRIHPVPLPGEHPRASPWLRLPPPPTTAPWSLSLPALSQSVLACHPSTGCGKSRLGAGPSFAQGAQVGGFLLLLTWPQTTPAALYLMWQGCCCPQGGAYWAPHPPLLSHQADGTTAGL